MTNTPQLEHWSVDMITNTQHSVHTAKLEKRIEDLETRIEDLERAFYQKVERPHIDQPHDGPVIVARI